MQRANSLCKAVAFKRRHRPHKRSENDPTLLSGRSGELYLSTSEQLLRRIVKRFRRGLVFKAHRLVNYSTLGSRLIKKKKKKTSGHLPPDCAGFLFLCLLPHNLYVSLHPPPPEGLDQRLSGVWRRRHTAGCSMGSYHFQTGQSACRTLHPDNPSMVVGGGEVIRVSSSGFRAWGEGFRARKDIKGLDQRLLGVWRKP